MERKAMRFVAPSGATFALLHVVPRADELLYSPNPRQGQMFHTVGFKTVSGFHGRDRIEVHYDTTVPGVGKGDMVHHNGVITFNGVEYHIDHARRTIDTVGIF